MKQSKELNEIYKKYSLTANKHIFKNDDYTMFTRLAISKIQKAEGIQIKYDLVHHDGTNVVIKATAFFEGQEYQTFGESAPKNNTFSFNVAIAEKRAQSRLILMMILRDYEETVMGEDEVKSQPGKSLKPAPTATESKKEVDFTLNLMGGAKKNMTRDTDKLSETPVPVKKPNFDLDEETVKNVRRSPAAKKKPTKKK